MSKRNPFGRGLSRRQALGYGLGAGAALMTIPHWRAFAQQDLESELIFGCNGGKTQEQFEQVFFPEFKEQTGADVIYVAGQPADNLAKVRAQGGNAMDAIWLAGAVTFQAIGDKLVMPLDFQRIPNYQLTRPELRTQDRAVAVGLTVTGIIYNEQVFSEKGWAPPTSWWDLWDPKYAGYVGSYSVNATAATALLTKIAQMLTGDYKNLDAAFAKMTELRPNMQAFYTSAGAYDTAMQQGDVWIGMNTSVRAQQIKDAGMPIGFVQPKEGLAGYETWAGITDGAAHPNIAHAWLNYLLSTEVQNRIPQTIGYAPVNQEATIPEELALYFPPADRVLVPDWQQLSDELPEIVERWNREVER